MSNKRSFYVHFGVRIVRKLVQDGDLVNHLQEKSVSSHYSIKTDSYHNFLNKTEMYERFHIFCFTFFALSNLLALIDKQYVLAVFILVSNIIYNLCPIMLQQYNRIRITELLQRSISRKV